MNSKLVNESLPVLNSTDIAQYLARPWKDKTMYHRLIALFEAETPGSILVMRKCIEDGDMMALSNHAHKLKGSSGVVGASKVADLATKLGLAADNDNEQVNPLLTELDMEIDVFENEAETFLQRY